MFLLRQVRRQEDQEEELTPSLVVATDSWLLLFIQDTRQCAV